MKIFYFLFFLINLVQTFIFNHHLSAEPKYIKNWDTVSVSWSKLLIQDTNDWIGVYSPIESENYEFLTSTIVNQTFPTFQLYNLRTPYEFRYFRGNCDTSPQKFNCSLVGTSNEVYFNDESYFQQIHLSLTQNQTNRLITMITADKFTCWVEYSTKSREYNNKISMNLDTYQSSDMCSSPANETFPYWYPSSHPGVGYIHSAELTDLKPGNTYYYRFGNDLLVSPEYHFEVQPIKESTQLIVYADQDIFHPFCEKCKLNSKTTSYGKGSMVTMESVNTYVSQNYIDYLVHVGDLSYARGTAVVWDLWSMMIQNTASQIPYMVSIGNHEYDYYGDTTKDLSHPKEKDGFHPDWGNYGYDSYGECAVPVNHRFPIDSNGNGIYWYSFNYNNVHNIILSSEHDYTPGSEMLEWLENDLKSTNQSWIFLYIHRPIYMSEVNLISQILVTQRLRESFEELLFKYKVDIVFQGHMHLYERTSPVYEYKVQKHAPIYITLGAAGISLDNCLWDGVDWSIYQECKYYGFGLLNIYNTTSLNWKFINSFDDKIIDEFTLNKN